MCCGGEAFRSWVAKQDVAGVTLDGDSMHVRLLSPAAVGYLTFLPTRDKAEVVELRIQRSEKARPSFLTHFVLDDEWRARKLYREMTDALMSVNRHGPVRVLVCDTPARPPSEEVQDLVRHLRVIAQEPSVSCLFEAAPLDEVPVDDGDVSAILLAPSVGHMQRQTYLSHPNIMTISIPKGVFESRDARRTFRLLLEAMGEIDTLPPKTRVVPSKRVTTNKRTVLVINVMYCDRCVRMGFRVYEGMREITRGKVTKSYLSMDDINDLLQTLFLYGVPVERLDAIELLVPGVVNYCSMNLPSTGDRDRCIAQKLEGHYGIPTYIDNNTNAAAMGCYVLQDELESLSLYRHQLGHMNGGQGTVVGGQLVTGLHGMAGEPKLYQRRFCYDEPYNHKVWSSEGLAQICINVLKATMATIAPDALFVSVGALDNIDDVRADLARAMPKYCEPQVIAVDDYRERMYVGAAALCCQRLEKR